MTSRRAQGVIGTLTYIAAQPAEHASGGLLDPDGTLGKKSPGVLALVPGAPPLTAPEHPV